MGNKNKIIFILIFLLISCSDNHYQYVIDDRLRVFVDSFYKEAELRGVYPRKENMIIKLGYIGSDRGLTKYSIIGNRVNSQVYVWISETHFNFSDYKCVESTVFHELAHALLFRHHCSDCESIMNISVNDYYCFGKDRDQLINELFSSQ